jgi:geranylgeranyl reductase family protein
MPRIHDVIVVGGGPSGSSAAYRLARSGRSVLVLEKSPMPREKLCGGAVSEQALRHLGFDLPDELIELTCHGARIHYEGRSLSARSDDRVAILVSRARFDQHLLERARALGAAVVTELVARLDIQEDGVVAETPGSRHKARLAIVANGAASGLTRLVRPKDGPREAGYCLEQTHPLATGAARTRGDDALIDVHFGVARHGYGWVFPHGAAASIGVGGLASHFPDPRGAMREFWTSRCGLAAEELKPKGWPIPRGGIRRPLTADRLVLAGDAAGFVDPFTGEGIAHAIRSGQLAADAADAALRNGALSRRALARAVRATPGFRTFERELRTSLRISQLMHGFPSIFMRILATEPELMQRYLLVFQGRLSYRAFFRWLLSRLPRFALRQLVASGPEPSAA